MSGIVVRPSSPKPIKITYGLGETVRVVAVPGPQGPSGADGGSEGGDISYRYVQSTASAEWTVTHGLGFRPNVQVTDTSGSLVDGDVQHLSATVTRLRFSAPFAGEARFS